MLSLLAISYNYCSRRTGALAYHHSIMLITIAVVLLVLWAVGLVTSYTIGGFIHLLFIAAIILVLVRLIQGKNPIG